jgi:hypothetical protein
VLVVLYCSLVADVDEVDGITEQLWMFLDTTFADTQFGADC